MGRKFVAHIDWPLVFLILALTVIGLANLYSATYGLPVAKYFTNQLIWVGAGILLMTLAMLIDYQFLGRMTYGFYVITVALLILVLMIGPRIAGSVRWIPLGPIHIQPSELMKIVMILTLARYFKSKEDLPPYGLVQLLVPLFLLGIPMYLIHSQPDLGTTLALAATGFTIMLFVGIHRRTLISLAITAALSIPAAWYFVLSDYQRGRVVTFLQPEKYALEGGYQVIQSKIAVGSGLLTGKGFLNGTQTKLMFLPKQYTDFVFSNFAEEWGFLGSLVLLVCFFLFVMSGLNIAQRAKDKLGSLIAIGVTAYFFWHVVVNIGMELGLLPVVGLPLPFLSYGGSITLTSFIAVGLLLNVSVRRYLF